MPSDYAPRGLVGVLVPQANTAVEQECAILLPPDTGLVAGRLVSARPDMNARIVEYFDTLGDSMRQFAGVPLKALGFACTGSSYLVGRDREDEALQRLTRERGCHVTSSALSVVDALHALDAHAISLVSPYPDDLTQASVAYWESRGFVVRSVSRARADVAPGVQPVYALGSAHALRALDGVRGQAHDAVVMLGTGMPSLHAIAAVPRLGGAPVLSCTLALAWRCMQAVDGVPCTAASLLAWIGGSAWKARLRERAGAAAS